MKAIVTKAFRGVKDGEHASINFNPGDEITGELARAMVQAGYARKDMPAAPKNAALEAAPANRFRAAGVEGQDGGSDSVGAKPKGKRGRPRKNVS